jgi:hypothetical protein
MAMTLDQMVDGVRAAGGDNITAIVLYGSAAGRDYYTNDADQDVLVLVRDIDAPKLRAMGPTVRAWIKAGNPPPLVLTLAEWKNRADVFAIEYADLLERHRVLSGDFPIAGMTVNRTHLRLQLESEAMGKLLRFRRGVLNAMGHAAVTRALLSESLSSILALMRATLHLHGQAAPDSSDALCDRVAALAGFDGSAFRAVLADRRGDTKLRDDALDGVVDGYHEALEHLVAHVDAIRADA